MKTSLRILVGLSRVAAVLALATTTGGCVAAKHYDEARSVAEAEMAGHAATRARLASALSRVDRLEQELRERELALSTKQKELDVGESLVAASKLETTVAVTEKRAAGELVDQLRAELARTGDHLRAFSTEKRDLERALLAAEERLRGVDTASQGLTEMVATARDLAIGLDDLLAAGDLSLGVKGRALALGVPSERHLEPETGSLRADVVPLVNAVAGAALAHPSYRVVVREPSRNAQTAARTESLLLALRERGIPSDRLAVVSEVEQATPAPVADAPAPAPEKLPEAKDEGRGDAPLPAAPAPAPAAPVAERYELLFGP
jgi:hypothetical protein